MTRFNKPDVLGVLQEHGAIMEGHFRLPSGLHTPTYIQTAVVLQYPHILAKVAEALNRKFPVAVDAVVSSGVGSLVVGQEAARLRECRSIFFERMGGAMGLRRHFRLEAGERVLIVEDVLSSGRTTGEVLALSSAYGAKVVGIAAIVDRSTRPMPFRVPVRALVTLPIPFHAPEACDLCAQGLPVTLPEERGLSGEPGGAF
jgi:orotate phosphoribosyltransferase